MNPGPGMDGSDKKSSGTPPQDGVTIDPKDLRRMLHDLRGPVRHVRGFHSIAAEAWQRIADDDLRQKHGDDVTDIEDSLNVIQRAGRSMDELLDAIRSWCMAIMPPDPGTMVGEKPLTEILRQVWDDVCRQHSIGDAKLDIQAGVDPEVDFDSFEKMLHQVLDNAVRYRDEKRTLEITVGVKPTADGWTCLIQDNGVGFPPQLAPRLLRPFERGSAANPMRPGMGLAIADALAKRQNCGLVLCGEVGGGAAVEITHPMLRPHSDGPDLD
ncbi:ATP-binding protein [Crateriforma conspicua]|nr:HAMP domain-containing sensor histidine kinase [Crateriforma conspicua]